MGLQILILFYYNFYKVQRLVEMEREITKIAGDGDGGGDEMQF